MKKCNEIILKYQPENCPECDSDEVYYERIAEKAEIFACDDCGWEISVCEYCDKKKEIN